MASFQTRIPNAVRASSIAAGLSLVVGLLVLASVWYPVAAHFHISNAPFNSSALQEGMSESSRAVLDELGRFRVLHPPRAKDAKLNSPEELRALLNGRIEIEGGEVVVVDPAFASEDLEAGSGLAQLYIGALVVPDRMLKAYEATGDEQWLRRALEYVRAFHEFERRAWLPHGALWDDHATAERVFVLVDLLQRYLRQEKRDPELIAPVVSQLRRAGEMLSKRGAFNYATNHGVMQNVALLHLATALPWLPEADRFRTLALDRLTRQMRFYISDEGVVLEGSPAYHAFGLRLLGYALRYATIGSLPVPKEWQSKFERGTQFAAILARPDGSLPRIGDTDVEPGYAAAPSAAGDRPPGTSGSVAWTPPDAERYTLPLSGYAVWWSGLKQESGAAGIAQTVTTWSDFPGHGHWRANQLATTFWAAGRGWWTDVGYWPYVNPRRYVAESWEGSGASRADGEAISRDQKVTLLAEAESVGLKFLELERATGEGLRINRQIIEIAAGAWLVIDSGTDKRGRDLVMSWTAEPDLNITPGAIAGAFKVSDGVGKQAMDVLIGGTSRWAARIYRGSDEPFSGWVVQNGVPKHAASIRVTWSGGMGAVFTLWTMPRSPADDGIVKPARFEWTDTQHWRLSVSTAVRNLDLVRDGDRITGSREVQLSAPMNIRRAKEEIQTALLSLAADSPRFREYIPWRIRVSQVLGLLLVVHGGVLLVARRYAPSMMAAISAVAVLAWLALAWTLHFVYFAN